MKHVSSQTSTTADDIATGEVYTTILIAGDEAPQVRLARMQLAPKARTAWHSHAGGEYLHVLEGTALVQERDGDVTTLQAGDTIFTDPDVEHWHGAPPDTFTTLLAIWGAPANEEGEPELKWGPQVTDEEMQTDKD